MRLFVECFACLVVSVAIGALGLACADVKMQDRVVTAERADGGKTEKWWTVNIYSGGTCVKTLYVKGEHPYPRGAVNGQTGFTFWDHTGEQVEAYGATIMIERCYYPPKPR